MKMKKLITLLIVPLLTASGLSIALVNTAKIHPYVKTMVVINGNASPTYSMSKYTQGFMPNIGRLLQSINQSNINDVVKKPAKVKFDYLPIKTPNMMPGAVQARKINFPQLLYPIFLVGSDENSLQWLEKYAPRLKKLHAVGLLVQANTKNNIKSINQVANGVPIIPASGFQIGKQFGVKHYPVLFSKHLIEQ